jgi:hypothetical protein
MKKLTKTLSATEIRKMNLTIDSKLHFEYQWDAANGEMHYLVVDGKRKVGFSDSKTLRKSKEKIRRMGLGFGYIAESTPSDLALGLNEAVRRGENPFACSTIVG